MEASCTLATGPLVGGKASEHSKVCTPAKCAKKWGVRGSHTSCCYIILTLYLSTIYIVHDRAAPKILTRGCSDSLAPQAPTTNTETIMAKMKLVGLVLSAAADGQYMPRDYVGGFRLRLYWETGFNWQDSSGEKFWCMECDGSCEEGDTIRKLFRCHCWANYLCKCRFIFFAPIWTCAQKSTTVIQTPHKGSSSSLKPFVHPPIPPFVSLQVEMGKKIQSNCASVMIPLSKISMSWNISESLSYSQKRWEIIVWVRCTILRLKRLSTRRIVTRLERVIPLIGLRFEVWGFMVHMAIIVCG